jgi:hypothetical protein
MGAMVLDEGLTRAVEAGNDWLSLGPDQVVSRG